MIVREIIDRFYARVPSDDYQPRPRVLYSKMKTGRSLLLGRRYTKGKNPSKWAKQTIDCIPVEKTNAQECGCVVKQGCEIYKTTTPVPETIMGDIVVTSDDGYTKYHLTSFETYQYQSHMKYTGDRPKAFIKNGYLYITKKGPLGDVAITGVFQDPVEAATMPSICEDDSRACLKAMDVEFHMDPDLMDPLVDMMFQEVYGKVKQIPEDESNNSQDNNP